MSLRTQRSLQALILAGLGLYLLQTIWSGRLYWYINERFMPLILTGAIGFLILARLILPRPRASAANAANGHKQHDNVSGGSQPSDANHDHSHSHRLPAWSLVIVAVPLALGVLVPARPLGTSAIANKGLNTFAPLTAGNNSGPLRLDLAPTDRTVLDWVRAFNYAESPAEFAGQPADVIGFVYHQAGLGSDEFLVSRFAVTCCSADAVAIGMLVRWPAAAGLQDNGWVRVTGVVEAATYRGQPIPLINAQFVEGVAAPAQPYLYP
jgi:putative membrane protein